MSDEATQATEEELHEAAAMGWADKDKWRGDQKDWVDAKAFLERGRSIMPMLQKNNERLVGKLSDLEGRLGAAEGALRAANATIKALEESQAEDVKAQVEGARAELRDELEDAMKDGDHALAAKLTDKLTQLNDANREAGGKEEKGGDDGSRPARIELPPDIIAWYEQNPDYRIKPRIVALSNAIAVELRQAGNRTIGPAFLDKVKEEVEKELSGGSGKGGFSKVEGAGGSSHRAPVEGAAKTYADLPIDAKAACDSMSKRLVGANRAHKDIDSWRKSYVKQYFEKETA